MLYCGAGLQSETHAGLDTGGGMFFVARIMDISNICLMP